MEKNINIQEQEAINYVENELISNHSDFQVQGF